MQLQFPQSLYKITITLKQNRHIVDGWERMLQTGLQNVISVYHVSLNGRKTPVQVFSSSIYVHILFQKKTEAEFLLRIIIFSKTRENIFFFASSLSIS